MITNPSNPPFISIIIPVYNKGQYLKRCFESLIDSTFSDVEIILVNDGSTDSSGEICEEYQRKDKRFKVFHQLNAGVSAARNKGIDEATGRWIYIIDPDDWIDKDAFDGIVSAIHSHPEVDIIWTYCREVHGDVVLNPDLPADIRVYTRDEFIRTDFLAGYMHAMIVRKEVIESNKLRLSPRLDFMEDVEFIFRCVLNSGNILLYNKAFYNYLTNETSSSINLNLKKVTDHLTAATLMKQYALSYNSPAVTKHVNRQLNHQVYLYFAEIRLIKDKSTIRAREIRANLLNFIRDNSLKINELSKKNLMLLFMGLIHIRLILAGHKIMPIVRFSPSINTNKQ
jgi:glycosyltransferase involved in cell wall biosynthesis